MLKVVPLYDETWYIVTTSVKEHPPVDMCDSVTTRPTLPQQHTSTCFGTQYSLS